MCVKPARRASGKGGALTHQKPGGRESFRFGVDSRVSLRLITLTAQLIMVSQRCGWVP